jgi:hypothetical protein
MADNERPGASREKPIRPQLAGDIRRFSPLAPTGVPDWDADPSGILAGVEEDAEEERLRQEAREAARQREEDLRTIQTEPDDE